jgi:formate--tetrahydrofolate ligase
MALKLAPIVITEAGFAADLGAEKFLDIKCRVGGLHPDCVVMVATIRALKMHGGQAFEELDVENVPALLEGCKNLKKHLENIAKYNIPVVVCINHFAIDTDDEVNALITWCKEHGYEYSFSDGYLQGGAGSIDLAEKVYKTLNEKESHYAPLYDEKLSIKEKIETICKEIYGAKDVVYLEKAEQDILEINELGYDKTPVCIAKTPQSLSDNAKLLGVPVDFTVTIREVRLSAGAGFVVPLAGKVMTMPGLPKVPAAVLMETKK